MFYYNALQLKINFITVNIACSIIFLFEAFLEAAPQLILQSSIVLRTGNISEYLKQLNDSANPCCVTSFLKLRFYNTAVLNLGYAYP